MSGLYGDETIKVKGEFDKSDTSSQIIQYMFLVQSFA